MNSASSFLISLARPPTVAGASGIHTWARGVMTEAWPVVFGKGSVATQRELDAFQSLAAFDGGYGRGYSQRPELQGKHNWGAIHQGFPNKDGTCPPGGVLSNDYDKNKGKTYPVCFKEYASDVEGAADVIRNMSLRRPKTWAAIKAGAPVQDWARWLYLEHYYGGFRKDDPEGNVTDYANNLWAKLQQIWAELGETPSFARGEPGHGPLRTPGAAPSGGASGGGAAVGLLALLGLVGLALARRPA